MKTHFSDVGIQAIAAVVPANKVPISELAFGRSPKTVDRTMMCTGISAVRYAPPSMTSSDLCQAAAEHLFAETGTTPDEVSALVFVSQSPDYVLPPTSCLLQHKLGLSRETLCYDVNGGCCGYIIGLQLAFLMARQYQGKVLLLAGETNSKLMCARDFSQTALLGDAGSATIVVPQSGNGADYHVCHDGSRYDKIIMPAGGYRTPKTVANSVPTAREAGNWRSDCDGQMDGMAIMNFALSDGQSLIRDTIAGCARPIDLYVFHQANKMILDFLIRGLKLDRAKVPIFLDGCGNTSSCSIPLTLCGSVEARSNCVDGRMTTLMAGFGVGLSWGTIVTDLGSTRLLEPIEI